jgi:hypothetical protein
VDKYPRNLEGGGRVPGIFSVLSLTNSYLSLNF